MSEIDRLYDRVRETERELTAMGALAAYAMAIALAGPEAGERLLADEAIPKLVEQIADTDEDKQIVEQAMVRIIRDVRRILAVAREEIAAKAEPPSEETPAQRPHLRLVDETDPDQ